MYPIDSSVAALFEAENAQVLRITGTDVNGTPITITDANVMLGGFNIDRYSCNGQKLEVGTAIAAEMELKLNNANGTFDGITFEGTELFVEVGVADWTQSNPTVHYIPIGFFTPDEQPRKLTTISLKALDRMTRFDAVQPTPVPWTTNAGEYVTDNNGNIMYFLANIAFPCTIAQLVARSAGFCNVPFTQDLSTLPNSNYVIQALPSLQQDITFRNIIQWCAGIMGTNAFIDWNGELRFAWYAAVDYTSTLAKRYSSDLHENDITITGVQYTNTQNITTVSGTADYVIDMTGNYLAANGIAEILPNVKNVVEGFSYRAFEASVISAPWLWPMDVITFTDKDGSNHSCAVTNVGFGLNGTTALAGKGETQQTNKGTAPSGVTTEQSFLIEKATQVAKDLDDALTQEEIFNRLTDNGETQGLLLYNGKIYLNASYINTGELSADLIKTGNLNASLIQSGTLNADLIRAGTLIASLIKAGVLASAQNPNNYWNMDSGEFVLKTDDESNGIVYQNGVLHINASNIDVGTLSANLIKAGILQDAAGKSYWNMLTGVMNIVGTLAASQTVQGNTYKLVIDNGQLSMIVNNSEGASISWGINGVGMYANRQLGGTVYLSAQTTADSGAQFGEINGGSWIEVDTNYGITFVGPITVQSEWDSLPMGTYSGSVEYVKDVENGVVSFGTMTIVNGLIVDVT